jgi:hypothetical protein
MSWQPQNIGAGETKGAHDAAPYKTKKQKQKLRFFSRGSEGGFGPSDSFHSQLQKGPKPAAKVRRKAGKDVLFQQPEADT